MYVRALYKPSVLPFRFVFPSFVLLSWIHRYIPDPNILSLSFGRSRKKRIPCPPKEKVESGTKWRGRAWAESKSDASRPANFPSIFKKWISSLSLVLFNTVWIGLVIRIVRSSFRTVAKRDRKKGGGELRLRGRPSVFERLISQYFPPQLFPPSLAQRSIF